MSRIKMSILTALAVFMALAAVEAVGASVASAAFTLSTEECTGGSFINACYSSEGKLLELSGENEFKGKLKSGTVVFKSEIGGEKITIECKAVTTSGTVLQAAPLSASATLDIPATTGLIFKECKLTVGPSKCEVKSEEPTVALTGTAQSATDVSFKPTSGESFIEIEFKNKGSEKCPSTILGKHQVKGKQLCEFLEDTTAKEKRGFECPTGGSELKFGTENATATVQFTLEVELAGLGDSWEVVSTA